MTQPPLTGQTVWSRETGSVAIVTGPSSDPKSSRFHVRIVEAKGHHKIGDCLVWTPEMIR